MVLKIIEKFHSVMDKNFITSKCKLENAHSNENFSKLYIVLRERLALKQNETEQKQNKTKRLSKLLDSLIQ